MSEKIIITSDSTTDLSKELIARYNIGILPLKISLDGELFTDGVDINPEMIYDHYQKTGHLPKTTATNIDTCINFFKDYADQGYSIVHFTISSEMSSTYQNAVIAAQEFDNVFVVDTKNLSTGGGLLVIKAAEMLADGLSAEEISKKCTELAENIDASFVIDSLEFLYKGGRCSALAALGANLLKLKPCIVVKDGKMGVDKKYRGRFSDTLKTYVSDRLNNLDNIFPDRIFITHAGCEDDIVNQVLTQVKALNYFKEINITRAGCTVSSHCGKDTLGVLFIRKNKLQ